MASPWVFDIHAHPTIKAYNSGHPKPKKNIWEPIDHPAADTAIVRWVRQQTEQIHKTSQSNFYNLAAGGVRAIWVSLYPIERGFLHMRDVPSLAISKNAKEDMLEHIIGIPNKRVQYLRSHDDTYFKDLQAEYEYLRDGQGRSPDGQYAYQIVNNYGELDDVIRNKPDTIAVIISIEGAHVFGCGHPEAEALSLEEHKKLLSKNIAKVKQWEHPPFCINLAHHFWNQLTGHARSMKPPVNALVNQNRGMDKGLTERGRHVLRELLSRENGKRIIIDTKHMSVQARKEYYGFVRNYNYLNPKDKIPLVCSHTGVNGYKDLDTSLRKRDSMRKSKKSVFHKWSINISDEEIRIIHESDGLIGLMLDKGMLGGVSHIEDITNLDLEKQKHDFAKLIWQNIFQIIKAVGDKSAWDVIALGSDYDGSITHMDPYMNATTMPELRKDLIDTLKKTKLQEKLWYGYTPTQLVNKLMYRNAMTFMQKFFV